MSSHRLLTILILVGLVLGTIVGQMLYDPEFSSTSPDSDHAHATSLAIFTFVGNTVFMGLLKMLIIPLVAASVICGVTSVGDFRQLGAIGAKTVALYMLTTLIAAAIGLFLVTSIMPGTAIGQKERQQGEARYTEDTTLQQRVETHGTGGVIGVVENLVGQIIPSNVFSAAAGGQPLPVIFFSIIFGGVLTTMGRRSRGLIALIETIYEAIMRLVQVVLWIAPVGVFALLAWSVARIGLGTFATAIGKYMVTVFAGLFIHGIIVLPLLLVVFSRTSPWKLMLAMRRALMTAFGTDSSSATLPVTIECAVEEAGMSRKAAGFVLPLGATINMDGTALYEAVAVVFLAQAYNVPLGMTELVLVVITATLAAVGAAGIPSAGLVTMVIVVTAVNDSVLSANPELAAIPIAGIGLILGVDRIVDMARTTINVWGDTIIAKIISVSEGES